MFRLNVVNVVPASPHSNRLFFKANNFIAEYSGSISCMLWATLCEKEFDDGMHLRHCSSDIDIPVILRCNLNSAPFSYPCTSLVFDTSQANLLRGENI